MQLGRMFSVFNKYMIYESTRKQEMLNETFFKTIYGKIGINYGDLIGIVKKKRKNYATSTIKNNHNIKNCKTNQINSFCSILLRRTFLSTFYP